MNCDSNSRLVVDEDDNGKLRLERVNSPKIWISTSDQARKATKLTEYIRDYIINSYIIIAHKHLLNLFAIIVMYMLSAILL